MTVEESSHPFAVLSPQALPPGTRIGRWCIEQRLGSGGNGTVYAVREPTGNHRYALKLAHTPHDDRFPREAQALRRVRHPGVVRMKAAGEWKAGPVSYPYLLLEYVRGATLYDWSRAHNPTARQVGGLLLQAARALAAAHRQGVLHRDFKGDNVRVDERGRLVLLDWGAGWHPRARELTSATRLPPGTGPYRSPQALHWSMQAHQEAATTRYRYAVADELYAVGVTFYRLLVEQYPQPLLSAAQRPSANVRALNPRVPGPLADWVHWLLAFSPRSRPAGAASLAQEVQRVLSRAGPDWDVPLFTWYTGPHSDTRTTQDDRHRAEATEEGWLQSAARRHDRVQRYRERRWRRHRVFAEVVTEPCHEAPARRRIRQFVVTTCALLLTAGGAWALMRTQVPAPMPGNATTPQWLASARESTDTAPPTTARPFHAVAPPWWEHAMPTTAPLIQCASRLHHYLLATTAAGVMACSGEQVRPSPANCPPEALLAMKELELHVGANGHLLFDIHQPYDASREDYDIVVRDGPIISKLEKPMWSLPAGTLVYGQVWTGGENITGRYTRVRTPDGNEYPVCFLLGNEEGMPKSVGSRPGYTRARPWTNALVVDRFP
ncbi:serine/threonine protein kinase [Myxococcus sp. Y35]|uniref:serine/threonine protein kinase n=1 Tax=Pseudomyxococcus flavus TaxID=3115648 RepID=UPI003CE678A4